MFTVHCREIIEADWPAILRIQEEVYYDFIPESEAVMRSKATRSPNTCFVAINQESAVIAYCLAYPYPPDRTAALGHVLADHVDPTDNLFLHDLAVEKASVGRGVAQALFNHLTTTAKNCRFRTMSLVAVQQAESYWSKQGFAPASLAKIHESYTCDATFMTKSIFALIANP